MAFEGAEKMKSPESLSLRWHGEILKEIIEKVLKTIIRYSYKNVPNFNKHEKYLVPGSKS